jgi:hypothetical protein
MKCMSKLALFAVASFLAVSGVQAQNVATADIPFDFICQQKTMPHGIYTISVPQESFIELSSKDGKIHAVSLVRATGEVVGSGGKLVFHRYGNQYFLRVVQIAYSESGMQLPTSKSERQVRLNEAKLQGGETTLLALK